MGLIYISEQLQVTADDKDGGRQSVLVMIAAVRNVAAEKFKCMS